MLDFLEKIYDRIKDVYGPKHFSALFILLVCISIAGFLIGFKYNKYIRQDPEYCNSCHLMEEAYANWRNSDHKTVTCQECHQLGVLEQNALLIKHILYGPKQGTQKHGKKLPWESCEKCHWEEKSQGKDLPEEAYGHYKHHFVECFNCHLFVGHNFPSDKQACVKCHREKKVHGEGMVGLSCVDCHIFSLREGTEKNRVIPTRQRCVNCHEKTMTEAFPTTGPMSSLECFECHNPHGAIKPDDKLCKNCHLKDLKGKGHVIHNVTPCKACHKAHTWKSGNAHPLCSSCHGFKDPSGIF